MRSYRLPLLLLALSCLPMAGRAQGDSTRGNTGAITGTVTVTGTSIPLPNAVVEIASVSYARLTDAQGQFVIPRIPAASYRVRVRRIGYSPREVEVVVVAGETAMPRIALTRLAVQLEKVTVASREPCTRPGLPAAGSEEASQSPVAAVLQQVNQNAAQFKLVTEAYPYEYLAQRTSGNLYSDSATSVTRIDTVHAASTSKWHYRPGMVVVAGAGPPGELSLIVPTFRDFAEPVFQQTHCFDYGGIEEVDGRSLARIDFRVVDTTSTPDVDGTIYLDTASFQVTRVRVDLTHPDALSRRRPKAYTAVTVMYHFAEIAPAVRVLDFMLGRNSLRAGSVRGGVVAETQEQHIVVFQFTKEAPSGAPKQP